MNTMKRIFSEESLTCVPKSRAYKKALAALSDASQDISALFAESTGSDASRLFERYQDASARGAGADLHRSLSAGLSSRQGAAGGNIRMGTGLRVGSLFVCGKRGSPSFSV